MSECPNNYTYADKVRYKFSKGIGLPWCAVTHGTRMGELIERTIRDEINTPVPEHVWRNMILSIIMGMSE